MSKIQLSDHFTYRRLLRFTLPSIAMMIFTSIYGVVDGFFVSNYVGKTAFAAVNLIYPYLQILGGVGAMFGVGGSALVAVTLGEGDVPRARRYFTMMVSLMIGAGVFFSVIGIIFLRPMALVFGANENLMGECMIYGATCLVFNTAFLLQYGFQSYLIVAEKPRLGLVVTVLAGCTNMVLDFLFMAVFEMGILGAALATGLSQTVGALIPILWFLSRKNTSQLHFTKTRLEIKPMLKACVNGASEMMTSVSASITGILYNRQLMHYAGEDGVAAYGVVMYAAFIFIGVYIGYSTGSSPIMGYHYGAQNHAEMKNVRKRSMILLSCAAIVLTAIAIGFAKPIASIFVGYDVELLAITTRAFQICSVSFLVMWFSMYASSLFTALNNGVVSAAISFIRALVLPIVCIIVLPIFFELDGVWYTMVVSEAIGVVISLIFMLVYKKRYNY